MYWAMIMSGKAILAGFVAMMATAMASPVREADAMDCSVTGAEVLGAGTSDAQVCELFSESLAGTGMVGQGADAKDVSIAVEIHKRGRVEARVSLDKGNASEELPVIALDVVDRPLKLKDVKALAEVVAKTLQAS